MQTEFSILKEETLSDGWGKLQSIKFEKKLRNGETHQGTQEMYHVGNGACILLYNKEKGTVILNQQLRLVTTYNGNPTGMLTEVTAGIVDDGMSAEETVKKETYEETGYEAADVKQVMQLYMSPGSFTEYLYFFTGTYDPANKPGKGGGQEDEGEAIEVMEVPFSKALDMVASGEIKDAKTVILLQYAKLNNLLD